MDNLRHTHLIHTKPNTLFVQNVECKVSTLLDQIRMDSVINYAYDINNIFDTFGGVKQVLLSRGK